MSKHSSTPHPCEWPVAATDPSCQNPARAKDRTGRYLCDRHKRQAQAAAAQARYTLPERPQQTRPV